jgi:hypothetical protein
MIFMDAGAIYSLLVPSEARHEDVQQWFSLPVGRFQRGTLPTAFPHARADSPGMGHFCDRGIARCAGSLRPAVAKALIDLPQEFERFYLGRYVA